MFCKKCGAEMSEDARYCPKCGYDTFQGKETEKVEEPKKLEDNEVKLKLKPTFKVGYKLLTNCGRGLLYIIIFSIYMFAEMDEVSNAGYIYKYFLGTILGVLAVYVIIKMIFEKIQYNHFEYNFYKTKVEYVDGFLNKEEKELKYKHIREVALRQNIIQRMFGIGTIRIFTNATSGYNSNNRNMNGLQIHCIINPQEQYKKVKELIDAEGTEE